MSSLILTEEDKHVNWKMREFAEDNIQLCLGTNNCEPNDADVGAYLDLQDGPDAVELGWVNTK